MFKASYVITCHQQISLLQSLCFGKPFAQIRKELWANIRGFKQGSVYFATRMAAAKGLVKRK